MTTTHHDSPDVIEFLEFIAYIQQMLIDLHDRLQEKCKMDSILFLTPEEQELLTATENTVREIDQLLHVSPTHNHEHALMTALED